MEFLLSLLSLMLINIVLSGDNAVVIAMACRSLPEDKQKKAIIYGSGAAIVLRLVLTLIAVYLLKIPLLQFFGGILLIIIAFKLLVNDAGEEGNVAGVDSLGKAVKTILVADLIMSLDNVLAIAGVANGNYLMLIIGLALSIPLIMFGSKLLMSIMNKFPVLVYVGASMIAWTAGEMMTRDTVIGPAIVASLSHYTLPVIITSMVIAYGLYERYIVNRKKSEMEMINKKISKLNDSYFME